MNENLCWREAGTRIRAYHSSVLTKSLAVRRTTKTIPLIMATLLGCKSSADSLSSRTAGVCMPTSSSISFVDTFRSSERVRCIPDLLCRDPHAWRGCSFYSLDWLDSALLHDNWLPSGWDLARSWLSEEPDRSWYHPRSSGIDPDLILQKLLGGFVRSRCLHGHRQWIARHCTRGHSGHVLREEEDAGHRSRVDRCKCW